MIDLTECNKLHDLFTDYKNGSQEIRNHKLLALYHSVYESYLADIAKLQYIEQELNEIEQFIQDRDIK
jgi:hypothetical protein